MSYAQPDLYILLETMIMSFMLFTFLVFKVGVLTPTGFSECSVPALRSYFSTTFLKNCGRGEASYLETVVGENMGILPIKHFCSHKASLYHLNFMEIIGLSIILT